jgi:hypothetical protein
VAYKLYTLLKAIAFLCLGALLLCLGMVIRTYAPVPGTLIAIAGVANRGGDDAAVQRPHLHGLADAKCSLYPGRRLHPDDRGLPPALEVAVVAAGHGDIARFHGGIRRHVGRGCGVADAGGGQRRASTWLTALSTSRSSTASLARRCARLTFSGSCSPDHMTVMLAESHVSNMKKR